MNVKQSIHTCDGDEEVKCLQDQHLEDCVIISPGHVPRGLPHSVNLNRRIIDTAAATRNRSHLQNRKINQMHRQKWSNKPFRSEPAGCEEAEFWAAQVDTESAAAPPNKGKSKTLAFIQ